MARKVCTYSVQGNYSFMYFQPWLLITQVSRRDDGMRIQCSFVSFAISISSAEISSVKLELLKEEWLSHGDHSHPCVFPLGGLRCVFIVLFTSFFLSSIQPALSFFSVFMWGFDVGCNLLF